MYFAALLSATDSVAAVSIVKEKYYPKLNAILFGESVMNDAISIVLFRTIRNITSSKGDIEFTFGTIMRFFY